MRGTRIFILSLLMGWAGWGAQPDYFPLHPGNQWVYRCGGSCAEPFATVEVVRGAEFEGRWYWMLNGFGGRETWLRQDADGVLWAFNPDNGEERRWYSFLAPEGETSIPRSIRARPLPRLSPATLTTVGRLASSPGRFKSATPRSARTRASRVSCFFRGSG
jgi:hypothetical protein